MRTLALLMVVGACTSEPALPGTWQIESRVVSDGCQTFEDFPVMVRTRLVIDETLTVQHCDIYGGQCSGKFTVERAAPGRYYGERLDAHRLGNACEFSVQTDTLALEGDRFTYTWQMHNLHDAPPPCTRAHLDGIRDTLTCEHATRYEATRVEAP